MLYQLLVVEALLRAQDETLALAEDEHVLDALLEQLAGLQEEGLLAADHLLLAELRPPRLVHRVEDHAVLAVRKGRHVHLPYYLQQRQHMDSNMQPTTV